MVSDGSNLRLGPGSARALARARYLEGLLGLGFCRLDPSIGRGQASGSGLARARNLEARPITSCGAPIERMANYAISVHDHQMP